MESPRKCKEKSLHTENSSNKNDTPHNKENKKKISIFNYLDNISYGDCFKPVIKNFSKICIVNHIKGLDIAKTWILFIGRVTAILWHPKYHKICAAASENGELMLLNLASSRSTFIPGTGPGGSIVGLKFNLENLCSVYTASLRGKICEENFYDKTKKTLISTNCVENWFTSLDVACDRKLLLAGDRKGNGILVTSDKVEKVWPISKRLHKDKVNHVEFSLLDPNIFVTASADHSVKIWDLRMLSGSDNGPDPLCTFTHVKGVTSAYFSPSNRYSLLTTDEKNEIRVYKSPGWNEELIIKHPHCYYTYITPIKATWHPLEDIIVVGRYPDVNFKERDTCTIDFFNGSTGELLSRRRSITGGITSLNAFNMSGDYMATASSCNISFTTTKDIMSKSPHGLATM